MESEYYTISEVAEMLGKSYDRTYCLASEKIGLSNLKKLKSENNSFKNVYVFTQKDIEKLSISYKKGMKELRTLYKSKKLSTRELILDLLQKDKTKEYTVEQMSYIFHTSVEIIKLNILWFQDNNKPIFDRREGKEVYYSWDG